MKTRLRSVLLWTIPRYWCVTALNLSRRSFSCGGEQTQIETLIQQEHDTAAGAGAVKYVIFGLNSTPLSGFLAGHI